MSRIFAKGGAASLRSIGLGHTIVVRARRNLGFFGVGLFLWIKLVEGAVRGSRSAVGKLRFFAISLGALVKAG